MDYYSFILTTMTGIFLEFLILYQFFFSPQVKRGVIISNKHSIYELPQELPNHLRLGILGNYERSGKSQKIIEDHRIVPSLSPQKRIC